jgi:F-type H+-transporting ATPase subunit delta
LIFTWRVELSENTSLTKDASFRYANALFNLSLETSSTQETEKDLDRILKIFNEDPNFSLFIKSPLYPRGNQLSTMKKICLQLKLHENVVNTILVMTSKRRLFALKEMILQYKDLCRNDRNELIVEVASVSELNQNDLDKIKKSINSKVDGNIIIKSKADPNILGGLVVKVGSKLIDTSIRSKLAKLKNNLKEVG